MRKVVPRLLALGILSPITSAAVTVRGAASCGSWGKNHAADNIFAVSNLNWLIGYLSGVATMANNDLLKGTDNDSIGIWVDNYCRARLFDDLDDAEMPLALELVKRKGL